MKGNSALRFGWELCAELGFSSSAGIQSGLKEQVICLEDKDCCWEMPGELKDQEYGQPGINVPETYLQQLTWASLNLTKDHLEFQGQHEERGIDYSVMGKVNSHSSSADTVLVFELSQMRNAQSKEVG